MGTIVSPAGGSNVYKGAVVPITYRSDTVDFGCGQLSDICTLIYKLDGVNVSGSVGVSQEGSFPQTQNAENVTMPLAGATAQIDVEGWGAGGQLNDTTTVDYNLVDPPSATCEPATLVTESDAQINATIAGTLLAGGSARFVWGTPAPATNEATTYAAGNVFATISGLAPNTTYNYRVEVLDAFGNIVATSGQCNFTTLVATTPSSVNSSQLVKLCSITGVTALRDCATDEPILLVHVSTSDGDVIPVDSTEFAAAATGAGVFSTMGFYRSYYADQKGVYLTPQPTSVCLPATGGDDVEVVLLCDDNGSFLRFITTGSGGAPTITNTALDGVTAYTPVGTVKICSESTATTLIKACDTVTTGGGGTGGDNLSIDAAPLQNIEEDVTDGETDLDGSIEIGEVPLRDRYHGLRYTANIPQGSTITAAYIQYTANQDDASVVASTYFGEAADNSAPFVAGAATFNMTTRTRTTATVNWAIPAWTDGSRGAAQQTPSLVSIVQEIVNRPGWVAGNALAIMVDTPTGQREAVGTADGAPDYPVLHVEFTTPVVGGGGATTTTCQAFYREVNLSTGLATGNDYYIDPADEAWKAYTVQGDVTLGDCACEAASTDTTPEYELLCMTDSAETRFVRVVRIASDGTVTIVGNYLPSFPAGQYVPVGAVALCQEETRIVQALRLCDSTDTRFIRHIIYNNTGSVVGILNTTLDGQTAYVPVGVVTDCASTDLEAVDFCLRANTAGAGYAVGEQIKLTRWFNPVTNTQVSEVAFNMTQGGSVVAVPLVAANFDECPAGGGASETVVCAAGVSLIRRVDSITGVVTFIGTNGAAWHAPAAYTIGACIPDVEYVVLCDNNGSFIRRIVRNQDGTFTITNLALDGVTAYVPVGTVVDCAMKSPTLESRIVNVAAGVTQNIAALVPVGRVLVGLSIAVLGATATITNPDGSTVTLLPVGFSTSFNADADGVLTPPTSVTATAGTGRIVLSLTIR